MSWSIFLISKSVKNSLVKIVRKPATLIGYLFFAALMMFNFMNMSRNIPVQENRFPKIIYLVLIIVLAYMSIIIPIYKGTKTFNLKFLPADGVYLMTGPVKPLTLIWFAQVKQSLLIILMSAVMFIQIPTLKNTVGLNDYGIALFIFGYLVLSVVPMVVCLCAFTIGLKNDRYKTFIRYSSIVIGALGMCLLLYHIITEKQLLNGLENGLTTDLWVFIPLIGWCYSIFLASITGKMTVVAIVSLICILITLGVSLVIIAKNTDEQFYEEALNTAELINTMKEGMKEGRTQFEVKKFGKKLKAKTIKVAFKREGIGAIIDKQTLLTRKKGFGVFDLRTLFITFVVVAPTIYLQRHEDVLPFSLVITLGIISYVLFFTQLISTQVEDLERHYLYMFPYHSFIKLIAISYWSFLKLLLESGIGFSILFILSKITLPECVLSSVFVALLGYLFYLISTLTTIIFGKTGSLPLRLFVRMIFYIIYIISIVVVMIIVIQDHIDTRMWLALLISDVLMIGLAVLMMIPTSIIVNKPEYNQ